ncbi:hypothetical protein JOM56_014244 [Amanita muscaria]
MPASAHGRNDPIAMREGTEFDALGQQFTTLVIISTFTAILIIAFLTLAHNLISGRQDIYTYSMIIEVGQFLALIGMATHAGVIIISGRCAVLASLVKLVYFYSPFGLGHAVQSSGPHPTSYYNDIALKSKEEADTIQRKRPSTVSQPQSVDRFIEQSREAGDEGDPRISIDLPLPSQVPPFMNLGNRDAHSEAGGRVNPDPEPNRGLNCRNRNLFHNIISRVVEPPNQQYEIYHNWWQCQHFSIWRWPIYRGSQEFGTSDLYMPVKAYS